MPASYLLGKRARTASGVDVAAPTVRSFFRALEVFGGEIAAVRSAARQIKGTLSLDLALAPFLATPEDGRLAYVLEGLTDRPGIDQLGVALTVAEMAAPFAAKIDELLGDPEADVVPDDDDVSPDALLVLGCAERLKIDPMTVLDWPLGLFLDARIAFSRPPKPNDDSPRDRPDLASLGIPTNEAA